MTKLDDFKKLGTKLNQKFKLGTKLKTAITLPRVMIVSCHVAVFKFFENNLIFLNFFFKKIKISWLDTCPVRTRC